MVQLSRSCRKVKLERDDDDDEDVYLDQQHKKQKSCPQMWSSSSLQQTSPLDEPSPLGLRLRKSPSLLDLIQMKLSSNGDNFELKGNRDLSFSSVSGSSVDKLKASNFPASLLRIGSWEYVSRHEGDLVAKCYFAKHKLVWEVLQGGLKSKIEIQWSDITALKANHTDDAPGTLDIVLARRPLFFRETNPQPRKHTLWQATSDFTGGQASTDRRHFLQCQHGLLSKHFEKLIQCDPRLNLLSHQPEILLKSPYFELKGSVFEDEFKCEGFDQQKNDYVPTFPGFRDTATPSATFSSSLQNNLRKPDDRLQETPSRAVTDILDTEENAKSGAEESKPLFKVPGLHASMSMSDLVSHIGQCISEQMTCGGEGLQNGDMLEEITQYLLSDSQLASTSDEKSLMSRVNSLCCLLQKNPTSVQNIQANSDWPVDFRDDPQKSSTKTKLHVNATGVYDGEYSNASECKQEQVISRKDSFGDLLLHLPRIASLPQLFNIAEDAWNIS